MSNNSDKQSPPPSGNQSRTHTLSSTNENTSTSQSTNSAATLPQFEVPDEFNEQMTVRANQSMAGVMDHVLGSVVNTMWSSFERVQQQSVYSSATNFLTRTGIKTCAFRDSRTGVKCPLPCVRDRKKDSLSDWCRDHKYRCEKERELKRLRELYGVDKKKKKPRVVYIDDDDDDDSMSVDDIEGADDAHTLQPSSRQQLPARYVIKNKRTRGEKPAKQPTVSSPRNSNPSGTQSSEQPPPRVVASPTSQLADNIMDLSLSKENQDSPQDGPEKSKDRE